MNEKTPFCVPPWCKYTLLGTLFGILFPIGAIFWEIFRLDLPLAFSSIAAVHAHSPLQYIIDTAPLFLGFFAFLAGKNKAAELELEKHRNHLDELVAERTRNLDEINDQLRQEISERNIAEKGMAEKEARLRTVMDSSKDGMIAIDREGHITIFNKAAEEMFGQTKEDMIGKSLKPILPPQYARVHEKYITDFFSSDGPFKVIGKTVELPAIKKDGSEFPIELSLSVGQYGQERFVLAIIRDVTDRKRSENEKAKLEDQLRQAQRLDAIGRLAGGVAHDFNNILTGIAGYSEMILANLGEGDPIFPDLTEIKNAADRAADLTQQLLAFSRKQIIRPAVMQINDAIENLQKMVQRLIGEDIRLTFSPGDLLWNIKADPTQVDQIMINLAVNARDAMPGGGELVIETENITLENSYLRTHPEPVTGSYVMLSVSDTGCGMDKKTIDRIFEPFFSTKAKEEGTGLGLSTVYGIVRQNDGFIDVQSSPKLGSTFKIFFPSVTETIKASKPKNEKDYPSGTETILLVEDEDLVRALARRILTRHGYKIIEAANGQDAVDLCKNNPLEIDLLLTDVVMPNMNGKDLYDKLNVISPDMKVLFMSGYTDNVIAQHGVLEKGTSFLPKPFTIDTLTNSVRNVLDTGDAEKPSNGNRLDDL